MYRRFSFFFFHQAINQFSLSNTSNIFFAFPRIRNTIFLGWFCRYRHILTFADTSPSSDVKYRQNFSYALTYVYLILPRISLKYWRIRIYINKYLYTSIIGSPCIEAAPIFRSQLHLVHFRYYKGVCLRGVECHRFFHPLIRAFVVSNIVDISKRGWSWRIVHGVVSHYFSRHWRIYLRVITEYSSIISLSLG